MEYASKATGGTALGLGIAGTAGCRLHPGAGRAAPEPDQDGRAEQLRLSGLG